MEYEYNPEAEKNRLLKERWGKEGKLTLQSPAIVPRGQHGEGGLDVFTLTAYKPDTDQIVSERDNLKKTNNWPEIHQLNNPIKTVEEWLTWYQKTTKQAGVIGALTNRRGLVSAGEFNQLISNQSDPKWETISSQFDSNLEQLNQAEEISRLWSEPLHPGEIPQQKSLRAGRRVIITGEGDTNYVFQGRTYSSTQETEHPRAETWRAYLQVETEDIPKMVEILDQMGEQIVKEGGKLDFKYLAATWTDRTSKINLGTYKNLQDGDPRIAIYFGNPQERALFLRRLATEHRDDMIAMSNKREGKARRPGSSVLFDTVSGKEFRHINVLDKPGHSEDVAANPEWRNLVRGSVTRR